MGKDTKEKKSNPEEVIADFRQTMSQGSDWNQMLEQDAQLLREAATEFDLGRTSAEIDDQTVDVVTAVWNIAFPAAAYTTTTYVHERGTPDETAQSNILNELLSPKVIRDQSDQYRVTYSNPDLPKIKAVTQPTLDYLEALSEKGLVKNEDLEWAKQLAYNVAWKASETYGGYQNASKLRKNYIFKLKYPGLQFQI